MSLARFVYYSAVVSGWAAFLGWLLAEMVFFRSGDAGGRITAVLVGGIVGAAIGSGLSLVAGLSNANWKRLLIRAVPGFVGGALGGAIGTFLGNLLYEAAGVPRAIGWAMVGMGIGIADGVYEQSKSKIRNGLVGGAIGGLIGGFLFDPIQQLISSNSGMSSRATAFVILGICIGALIGLTQVVLKHAWLTVLDGYRCGRQLILSQETTVIGRAEHLSLPFLGPSNRDLELEHLQIVRQANGTFLVQDNHTRIGSRLNGQPVQYPARLKDGDVIKLGANSIRFNERQRQSSNEGSPAPAIARAPATVAPPPMRPSKGTPVSQPSAIPRPVDTSKTSAASLSPPISRVPNSTEPPSKGPKAKVPPPPPRRPQT